ncbi:hypothetical protein BDW62DRAFT_208919 [Aspergillus aurantiobrunneus]
MGSFNSCFRLEFEYGFSSLLRLPCPGSVVFAEKVRNELAIMTFLKKHTKIHVPTVISYGMADQSPENLGPFILMEYINNTSKLTTQLRAPGYQRSDRLLDPDIEGSKLEFFYSQAAGILLELSKPFFNLIGCMTDGETGTIDARPLTMNMNELVQLGNFPRDLHPRVPFTARQSISRVWREPSPSTCRPSATTMLPRRKTDAQYIAKRLVCGVMEEGNKTSIRPYEPSIGAGAGAASAPFKLFCDDLPEYTHSPAWCLLFEMPEEWSHGAQDWEEKYQPRLETFLLVLKAAFGAYAESWTSGDFWIHYGLPKSWVFDAVWTMLDERREALLCTEARMGLLEGSFTRRKLEEAKEERLHDWNRERN